MEEVNTIAPLTKGILRNEFGQFVKGTIGGNVRGHRYRHFWTDFDVALKLYNQKGQDQANKDHKDWDEVTVQTILVKGISMMLAGKGNPKVWEKLVNVVYGIKDNDVNLGQVNNIQIVVEPNLAKKYGINISPSNNS